MESSEIDTTTRLGGASLVGGVAVRGSGTTFFGVDPRTGAALSPHYTAAGPRDVERAAAIAWDAFPSYRKTTPEQRARFLESIADNIQNLGDELTDRVVAETGIPRGRVEGETARTVGQLRLFAAVLRKGHWQGARIDVGLPDRRPIPRSDIRMRKVPVGPVAVFGASNFPLAFSVAGGDTASALAAGSPVVVKAHSAHPGTSELVGLAIQAAVVEHELPAGVFSLLFGSGREVGIALVRDPHIKAVGFTGSRSAGLAIVEAASTRPEPIPVYAEMSSINPVFVLPEALDGRATELGEAWIASVTTGVGQLCTNPGLVFLPSGDGADAFIAAASRAVTRAEASPMLTDGIAAAYVENSTAVESVSGVRRIAEGSDLGGIVASGLPKLFATDADTFLANESLRTEMFGPASVIVTVRDIDQMVDILDSLDGQLTVTIQSDDDEPGTRELMDSAELKAGRIVFNGWPTGVEVGHAMVHGGPSPATSQNQHTSVGSLAIERFLRPVSYQNVPAAILPPALQNDNPFNLWRLFDGELRQQ